MKNKDQLMHDEWNNWQNVCFALKESGAVTEKDLKSSQSEYQTPGQMLIQAIRVWGKSLCELTKVTGGDK